MSHLLLLDAYALIYRAYYATLSHPRLNPEGINTSPIHSFTMTLDDLLKRLRPTHAALVLDPPHGITFRHDLFESYKANRPPQPHDITVAVPHILDITHAHGIQTIQVPLYEADDIIGTLAREASKQGIKTTIITPDKDYTQLLDDNITILKPSSAGYQTLDTQAAIEHYDLLRTSQIIDLLALAGDSADNIKGCPGVGPKTAATLLRTYGDIPTIIEAAREGRLSPSLNKKITDAVDDILLARTLTTIKTDVPLPEGVTPLSLSIAEQDTATLTRLYTELHMPQLLSRLGAVKSTAKATAKKAAAPAAPSLFDAFEDSAGDTADSHDDGVEDMIADDVVTDLKEHLHDLHRRGLPDPSPLPFDTTIAQYLINPTATPLRPENAKALTALRERLTRELDAMGLLGLYNEVELPLSAILCDIEEQGICLDTKALSALHDSTAAQLETLTAQAGELAGRTFNPASPTQVGEILFDALGLQPTPPRTPTGAYTTTEESLQRYAEAHPLVPVILRYRHIRKLLTTYIDALPRLIDATSRRLHTTLSQTGTATGRLTSTRPNLQNIPVRTPLGREIRRCIVAPEGHTLLSMDYSQIEIRLLAHYSQDPLLLETLRDDKDMHTITASQIYDVAPEAVTAEQRATAKTANYGIIYGITAHGLAAQLSISQSQASHLIRTILSRFPGISRYIDTTLEQARTTGSVTTLAGRARPIADINSKNPTLAAAARRIAINTPLQGSAADIIKKAMVQIHRHLLESGLRSRIILQIHDELLFDVYPGELERLCRELPPLMTNPYELSVPLTLHVASAQNWLDAH